MVDNSKRQSSEFFTAQWLYLASIRGCFRGPGLVCVPLYFCPPRKRTESTKIYLQKGLKKNIAPYLFILFSFHNSKTNTSYTYFASTRGTTISLLSNGVFNSIF